MTTPGDQTNPPPATEPPSSPPAQQPAAPTPPRPVVVNPPPATQDNGLADVLAAVRALPETLVNAFKESVQPAVTPPSAPEQPATPPASTTDTPPATPVTPEPKYKHGTWLADKWYGGKS